MPDQQPPPLRLAMIGTRGHHHYVLDRLPHLPHVQLVAAADGGDSIGDIARYAAAHGIALQTYGDDWLAMFDTVRPDAVVVAGPFELHAAMTVAAIDRGIHVYVEKLAALNEAELTAIEAAHARRPDVRVAGMMAKRYDRGFYAAHSMIARGAIGRVRLINVRKSYRLGTRPPFYSDRATYGGTIPWVGSHAIDWALWYAAPARPRRVYFAHSSRDNGGNGTMERSAAGVMTFDDELFVTVSIDVFRPQSASTHGDDWARVVGTEGVIEARTDGIESVGGAAMRDEDLPPIHPFDDFIRDIRTGKRAVVNAQNTIELTRVCLAARRSADEGRAIDL